MTNPHSVLGVDSNASEEEVKLAYRKLVKEHHPDRGGDEEHFKKINEAYDNIKNPPPQQPNSPFQHQADPFAGFEEMFTQHFGGRNPFNHQRTPRNQDIRIVQHVSLEEITNAVSKDINVKYGTQSRRVTITVPHGVHDGVEVKYVGYGVDTYPGPLGNLIVHYKLKKHSEFDVEGFDLVKRLNITIKEAMFGTEKIVNTIEQRQLKVNIKPGTQSKTRLRIPESGLPRRNQPNANLYVEINVVVPALDEKDLEKKLKDVL
tara:strand:- start:4931 stop:5713 length:783 start_codon:yes stop_codon:yes gene_type:complete